MNSYIRLIAKKLKLDDNAAFDLYMSMCGSGFDFSGSTDSEIIREAKMAMVAN